MASFQNANNTMLALQEFTHGTDDVILGTELSVVSEIQAEFHIYHGFIEGAIANDPPQSFRIQSRPDIGTLDNRLWSDIHRIDVTNVTPVTEALNGTVAADGTVLTVDATAGFTIDQNIYIRNTTLASSQWARVKNIVTDVSIDIIDGLQVEQTAAATTLFSNAEMFAPIVLTLAAKTFVRAVYYGYQATAPNTAFLVEARRAIGFT